MEIDFTLDPEQADLEVIDSGIVAANRSASRREPGFQRLALLLRDPQTGHTVGGLSGWIDYDWLFVHLLFVPDPLRGQGHGTRLMGRIEDVARERGAVGIWLNTFSFQARPFYEGLGYTVFGTLEGQPVGGAHYFMQKRLTQ